MKTQPNFLSLHRWMLIIFGLLTVVGCYVLYSNLIRPIVEVLERTPEPMMIYSAMTVAENCGLLNLDTDDSFCSDPLHQTPVTFADALERKFDLLVTTHDEIMPALSTLQSKDNLSMDDFKENGCQPPSEKNEYSCVVIFPYEVGMVWIEFDSSGRVLKYRVQGMLGGT